MQARILKWQEKAQDRDSVWQQLETYRQVAAEKEFETRRLAVIEDAMNKIPPRYQHKRWEDFTVESDDQKKIKTVMERYVMTFKDRLRNGNNVVFTGKPGTGKTLLSLIVYRELTHAGFRCTYQSSLDFLRSLQEKKFASSSAFLNAMESYQRIDFLIMDEVTEGSGKGGLLTDWEKEILFKIINVRYQQQRCTLVISNQTRAQVRMRLGEPTHDRLSDKGIALAFNWKSYRK